MEVIGALKMSETELNLGLGLGLGLGPPRGEEGVAVAAVVVKSGSKRGFSETMDLKLNLVSSNNNDNGNDNDNDSNDDECGKNSGVTVVKEKSDSTSSALDLMKKVNNNDKEISSKVTSVVALDHSAKPPAKAQVVGWPPVRSYRKNMLAVKKAESEAEKPPMTGGGGGGGGGLVKVSMDGAPYLRKVDLKMYNSYQHLSDALSNMFSSFTLGNYGAQGMIDFMNESKVMDLINGSDYVPTYEDKDGDWMLVGDVPWGMFVESCKRLRIMKGKEAAGLAPRAMEKCKNRS